MALPVGYTLATDAQFLELGNFTTPPRAGRITALEASGQVRVETDDPDGGDVLAWPLNGFGYAVGDVVYLAFAVNNPESALVIGSKGPGVPASLAVEQIGAFDADGVGLVDDAGNAGVTVADGGNVGIRTAAPIYNLHVVQPASNTGKGILIGGDEYVSAGHADNDADEGVVLLLAVSRTNSNRQLWVMPTENVGHATNGGFRLFASNSGLVKMGGINGTGGTELPIVINENGAAVGYGGVGTPQGLVHAHTGTGGMMFVSKSGIVGSGQTILANGTGDIVRGAAGFFVLSDGSTASASTFTVTPGNNVSIVLGGSTWQLQCNANGALTVIRTAGGGTASLALLFCWL